MQTADEARRLVAALRRAGMNVQTDGVDGKTLGGHSLDVCGDALDEAALDTLVGEVASEAVQP